MFSMYPYFFGVVCIRLNTAIRFGNHPLHTQLAMRNRPSSAGPELIETAGIKMNDCPESAQVHRDVSVYRNSDDFVCILPESPPEAPGLNKCKPNYQI